MKITAEKFRQVLGFLVAGVIGFLIEWIIISHFITNFEASAIIPRFISFPIAVVVTWYINRRLSFNKKTPPSLLEFIKYFKSTVLAQGTNFLSYSLILISIPSFSALAALIIASFISINVSFCLYLNYVFK